MTLYSADVLDVAKPVAKKTKGKTTAPPHPQPEPEVVEITPPAKKKPTEKQLAALAKAQESRKRKRAEKEVKVVEEEEKVEPVKEKKRPKKVQQVTPPPSMDEEIDRAVAEIIKTDNNKENEPPSWFKQYVAGVKKEEAKISREKKPKKQIQREAAEVANKNWSDSFTRDRVRNEVDGHMSRMYQMMFAGRRMK